MVERPHHPTPRARWWADRPVGVELATLAAVGALGLAGTATTAHLALTGVQERTVELVQLSALTRATVRADMAHDAVRADVLQALPAPHVTGAAAGSGEIAVTITGVATAAQVTTEGVAQAQEAVTELAAMSVRLQSLLGRFTF